MKKVTKIFALALAFVIIFTLQIPANAATKQARTSREFMGISKNSQMSMLVLSARILRMKNLKYR